MNKHYLDMYQDSGYLAHHGVQGQKWGVTNGPPYPLGRDVYDLLVTANGSKDYSSILKAIKNDYKNSNGAYSKEQYKKDVSAVKDVKKAFETSSKYNSEASAKRTADFIAEKYKNKNDKTDSPKDKSNSDVKNKENKTDDIKNKSESYKKKYYDKLDEFYESKEYAKASQEAYEACKEYFKSNYPKDYSEITSDAKKRFGDDYENHLDGYHDFRKTFEGFEDEYTSKAQEQYFKDNPIDDDD